jgi:hypothetical protein
VILDDTFLDRLAEQGPIGKTLGMLIRPTFIASPGKTLVWGDWSAIEARTLPWLANSPGAERVLDVFRHNDKDPSLPDIYEITAGELLSKDASLVTKKERQAYGKVPTLSLGFGGGFGALQKMAVAYGVYLDEAVGRAMVPAWRDRNAWAPDFWGHFYTDNRTGEIVRADGLWGAANMALRNPGEGYAAGRVAYVFDKSYLGGTLFCMLPCGRPLTYPDCRYRTKLVKDKNTGEEEEVHALWYRKGRGWSALWYGKLAENVTQATAGSILRETLVRLEDYNTFMPVVGHTHDEVVTEPGTMDALFTAGVLKEIMQDWKPAWRADLPLSVSVSENWYYTKALD